MFQPFAQQAQSQPQGQMPPTLKTLEIVPNNLVPIEIFDVSKSLFG
jgi:hypothetical protein